MEQYVVAEESFRKNSQRSLPQLDIPTFRNNQHQGTQQRSRYRQYMFNLKSFKTPQVASVLQEEFFFDITPHPNSSLVTPFLKIFHWSLLVPDVVDYDRERGGFYCKKGRLLLKGLSYIWLLFLSVYLALICLNDVSEEQWTVKAIIAKITWICYTLFDVVFVKCLRNSGDKIAKILSVGNRISYLCEKIACHGHNSGGSCTRKKKTHLAKYVIMIICMLSVVYTFAFVLFVITELTAVTTNLYNTFMDITSQNEAEMEVWRNHTVAYNLIQRYTSNPVATIVLTMWILMALGIELIWVIFLAMFASFGYYFKRLLSGCIQLIENNHIDTCEGIRIFTKITLLLEDFNQLFGSTLLWIVIASVMYTSLTLGEFLAGISNGLVYDMLNILGFLPFLATLYTGSELHKTGQLLPSIIKRQFLHFDATDQCQMLQVIQGTSIVQFQALSNNIGLKGHGFFTISYIFVTSIVGVTITYSMIAVQFKLGEIPLN